MTTRTLLIIFGAIFSVGLLAIVIVPFFLVGRSPRPESAEDEALADQGVFRSPDGGSSWQQASWIEGRRGTVASFRVHRLVPDPVATTTLYLLTSGNGLWVTDTRGDLWTQVGDRSQVLRPDADVLAMAVNPEDRREWYLAVFQGNRGRVLRTTDGGASFREIYFTPVERFGVFDVHYDRASRAVTIATGQGGVLETRNAGATWRVVRWFADGIIQFLVSPVNPAVRFAVTPRGSLFRTTDGGATWADVTPSFSIFSGATARQRWLMDQSGTLYLGSDYGLLRSVDHAATFIEPSLIIPPNVLPVLAIAVDSRNVTRIFVSAIGQLFASSDYGTTWEILLPPTTQRVTQLLVDRGDANILYAVVQP